MGLGRAALRKAVQYAKERVVFDRPIGMNQAIQHPLAERWMNLEAANLMVQRAARTRNPTRRRHLLPDGFRVRRYASPRNDGLRLL